MRLLGTPASFLPLTSGCLKLVLYHFWLLIAYLPFSAANCSLFTSHSSLLTTCCSLLAACCFLPAACCLLLTPSATVHALLISYCSHLLLSTIYSLYKNSSHFRCEMATDGWVAY